jgi:hypothetical protein
MNTTAIRRQVRNILTRIDRAMKSSQEVCESEMEAIATDIRKLPCDEVLDVLDEILTESKGRRYAAMHVLAELSDLPRAAERIRQELTNSNAEVRRMMIELIASHKWTQFAPDLNNIILHDSDELCRAEALRCAGCLKQDVNFGVILQLAEQGVPGLSWVLKDYAREEGHAYLQQVMEQQVFKGYAASAHGSVPDKQALQEESRLHAEMEERIIAAWGLARLGDRKAVKFLGKMLYDPVSDSDLGYDPGHAIRAAQAIADVYGLPFEWGMDAVARVREWWEVNQGHLL